jgi:hypothetical protein
VAKKTREQVQLKSREPDPDRKISLAFADCFKTPSGAIVLAYLRKYFVQDILAPSATDAELRFREGQRSIVGIIDTRIKEAEREPTQ